MQANPIGLPPENGIDPFRPVDIPVYNPAATALTQYGFYALDIVHTETLTADPNIIIKSLSYVTPVLTNNIASGIIGVVQSAIPAKGVGILRISGVSDALVNGGTDILLEDPLSAATGTNYAVKTAGRFHAIALEGYTSSSTVAKKVLLLGGAGTI